MSSTKTASQRTGRKVLALFVGGFGVIIGVNMVLLYSAIGSWPGLETKNAYSAALGFDQRRKAQEALNWVAISDYKNGDVVITLRDDNNKSVPLKELNVIVGRATRDNEDRTVIMDSFADSHRGATDLAAGNWQVRIHAIDQLGNEFRQIQSLIVE